MTLISGAQLPTSSTLTFDVSGLHCGACVGRAEQAFRAVDGVVQAQVNLATETAVIEVTSAGTLAKLDGAAIDAGYPLTRRTGDVDRTQITQRKQDAFEALQRMFIVALALTLPVVLLEMGGHVFPAFHHWLARTIGMQTVGLIQFTLATAVLIWPGRQFFALGLPALAKGAPDMNALVALGTGAAWAFSTLSLFAPRVLPNGTPALYFEAAAVIVTLILLGRMLETRAKGRTGDAIRKLAGLRPKTARVERASGITDVPLEEIIKGDILQVRPGERIAVDGTIVGGETFVDESMLTGEPMPAGRKTGDTVRGGTVNGTGAFSFRADAVGQDMMLAQIIRMVEDAQGARLPIQDLVNRITLYFVPVVMAVAVLTVVGWLVVGPQPGLGHALVAGVAVLIIACPCAMGLATPTSIMVGTGRAAELGVLFRQGDALQRLQAVDWVVFDKTGTLTEGRPVVTDVELADGFAKDVVLKAAASVEAKSEHPLAHAILAAAQGLPLDEVTEFTSYTGLGASGRVGAQKVLIGSARLMRENGVDTTLFAATAQAHADIGKTPIHVAIGDTIAALIAVSDQIKPTTAAAVKTLQSQGLKIAMISGDEAATANAIGASLGIDHIHAGVLPAGKQAVLRTLQADGAKVAFVGDGINDAPALAAADVGIAIGTGTDVAIEAADVVLMSGNLQTVQNAIRISTQTMRNIRQNLFWAFGYNIVLIPVAAGLLYPIWGVLMSPVLAAGAMTLSSVFVVTNALRLRWAGA